MGSEDFYPGGAPRPPRLGRRDLDDESPVTAAQFRRFVRETEYVTLAERPLDTALYPDADLELLVPGSLVFRVTTGPVDLNDHRNWWEYVPGAYWKRPGGRGTSVNGRDHHPVVHVAYEDAEAYAAWAGKELPSEAEWEYAARGGLEGATFAWGDERFPEGQAMANTWQGEFPWQNLKLDGYAATSPVGTFPPNGYGLHDMTGNVWEWTSDWFTQRQQDGVREPVLRATQPAGLVAPGHTRRGAPATGDQGRLTSVRAELLPPLPTGCATGTGHRLLDDAPRLSVRGAANQRLSERPPRLAVARHGTSVARLGQPNIVQTG